MPENTDPNVIYLEADSEITEAIDKLKSSHASEVRLAVPARSTMLQSAVNLKLLKKAASSSHKKLILVSTDKATISLAAGLGILMAHNVKAEPSIPEAPTRQPELTKEPVVLEQEEPSSQAQSEPSSSKSSKSSSKSGAFEKKHISLSEDDESIDETSKPSRKEKRANKSNEPKVPNFMGLNKKIAIFIAVLMAIILFGLAYVFLPTAKITLIAKAVKTPVNVKFTLDAGTKKSDFENGVVAADQISTTKDLSAQYSATGKKDVGAKASGTISIRNCDDTNSHQLAAGSTVSSGGKNFATTQAVTIPAGSAGGGVVTCSAAVSSNITATASGDSYNLSSSNFSISGLSSLYKATGTTSGGTTKVATVVTQADIDKAKTDMINSATESAKQDLQTRGKDDQKVFVETFQSEVSNINTTAPADTESSGGTVSARVKYTELAAAKNDLDKLFEAQTKTQVPGNNQIYQTGATDAKYTVVKLEGTEKANMQATSNAYYGQTIDTNQVAHDVAGKSKKGLVEIVQPKYSQVSGVQAETTPALLPYLPYFANRITVEIKVSTDQ